MRRPAEMPVGYGATPPPMGPCGPLGQPVPQAARPEAGQARRRPAHRRRGARGPARLRWHRRRGPLLADTTPRAAASASSTTQLGSNASAPVKQGTASAPDWTATASVVSPSVVSITATLGPGRRRRARASSSTRPHVLTNNHVVAGAEKLTVTLADGRTYDAEVRGTDPSTDLAVITVKNAPSDLTPIAIGNSDKIAVGDPVMAVGNPLGLAGTVTTGIVSALNRPVTTEAESQAPSDGSQLDPNAPGPVGRRDRRDQRDPDLRRDQPRQQRWRPGQRRAASSSASTRRSPRSAPPPAASRAASASASRSRSTRPPRSPSSSSTTAPPRTPTSGSPRRTAPPATARPPAPAPRSPRSATAPPPPPAGLEGRRRHHRRQRRARRVGRLPRRPRPREEHRRPGHPHRPARRQEPRDQGHPGGQADQHQRLTPQQRRDEAPEHADESACSGACSSSGRDAWGHEPPRRRPPARVRLRRRHEPHVRRGQRPGPPARPSSTARMPWARPRPPPSPGAPRGPPPRAPSHPAPTPRPPRRRAAPATPALVTPRRLGPSPAAHRTARAAARLVPPRGRRDPRAGRRGRRHHDGRRRDAPRAGRPAGVVRPRARGSPPAPRSPPRSSWLGVRGGEADRRGRARGRQRARGPGRHRCRRGLPRRRGGDQRLRLGRAGAGARPRRPASRSAACTWPVAGAASCWPCSLVLGAAGARPRRRAGRRLGRLGLPRRALRGRVVGRRRPRPARRSPWCASLPVTLALLAGAVDAPGGGVDAVGLARRGRGRARGDAGDLGRLGPPRRRATSSASAAVALLATGLLATSRRPGRARAHARPRHRGGRCSSSPRPACPGGRSARWPATSSAPWAPPAPCWPCWPCCPGAPSGSSPPACCSSPWPGSPRPGSAARAPRWPWRPASPLVAVLGWAQHPLATVTASAAGAHDMVRGPGRQRPRRGRRRDRAVGGR